MSVLDTGNRSSDEQEAMEVAENNRITEYDGRSFVQELIQGSFSPELIYPIKEAPKKERVRMDAYLAKLKAWCEKDLNWQVSAEIARTGTIPAYIFEGLHELGVFGWKVPEEYGGMGFNVREYLEAIGTLALYDGSVASMISAHCSIGLTSPLAIAGTIDQKKRWYPYIAAGNLSAFCLTEYKVGSSPSGMETTAEYDADSDCYILNGTKLWASNSIIANVLVVMAVTTSHESKRSEISAFIVPTDLVGVTPCHKTELISNQGLETGVIQFHNVRVPAENLLGERGSGLRIALKTLNDGRQSISAMSGMGCEAVFQEVLRWGASRKQWGRPVMRHSFLAHTVSKIGASALQIQALTDYTSSLAINKNADYRIESAMGKLVGSERAYKAFDDAVQVFGGRGMELEGSKDSRGEYPFQIARIWTDSRLARIVEGTDEIMRLLIGREILEVFLGAAGPLLSKKTSMGTKVKTALFCAKKFAPMVLRWFTPSIGSYSEFDPRLRKYMRFIQKSAKRLSFRTFLTLLKNGPGMEYKQRAIGRIVDVSTELTLAALTVSKIQSDLDKNGASDKLEIALFALEENKKAINDTLADFFSNTDDISYNLSKQLFENGNIEPIPEADMSKLHPIAHREKASDMINGSMVVRQRELDLNFKWPDHVRERIESHLNTKGGAAK